jgi:hypothetical protein
MGSANSSLLEVVLFDSKMAVMGKNREVKSSRRAIFNISAACILANVFLENQRRRNPAQMP